MICQYVLVVHMKMSDKIQHINHINTVTVTDPMLTKPRRNAKSGVWFQSLLKDEKLSKTYNAIIFQSL